jgi:hypothetical protein
VILVAYFVDSRFDRPTLEKFELMRRGVLDELRDCLMELLDVDAVEKGLLQAKFLLLTMRRLLVDGNMNMDLQGS